MPSKPTGKDRERETARRVISDEERQVTLPDGSTRTLRVDLSVLAKLEEKYGSWRDVALSFIRDDRLTPMLDVLRWSGGLADDELAKVSIGDFAPDTFATCYNVLLRDVGVAPDGDDDEEGTPADQAGADPSPPSQGTPPA